MTLYRKYRPRTFAELVGQEHVTRPLVNALKSGRTAHAYIFCGPRGSGKTSMAKLFGKAINCVEPREGEPCGSCDICVSAQEGKLLDILELDAASNRGIAEIREIRDHVGYAATQARYKVYILDEAHMLTKDASNAFLKTLEEPPGHIVFILVTTEIHKIMPTILSRCQRYDFRKVDRHAAVDRLMWVAEQEGIDLEPNAAAYLVQRGDGSLRDTIGLLEQVASSVQTGDPIEVKREDCVRSLGLIGDEVLIELMKSLAQRDPASLLKTLSQFDEVGLDAKVLTQQLIEELRGLAYLKSVSDQDDPYRPGSLSLEEGRKLAKVFAFDHVVDLLGRLAWAQVQLKSASFPYFTLELALLSETESSTASSVPVNPPVLAVASPPIGASIPIAAGPQRASRAVVESHREEIPVLAVAIDTIPSPVVVRSPATESIPTLAPQSAAHSVAATANELEEKWPAILERVRKISIPTSAFLKEVVFSCLEGKNANLYIRAGREFHMAQLRDPRHNGLVKEAIEKEIGRPVQLNVSEEAGARGVAPVPAAKSRAFADNSTQALEQRGVQQVVTDLEAEIIGVRDPDL